MLLGFGLELRRRRLAERAVATAPGSPAVAPGPAVPALPTGTVTFLFTDIEGSTRLLQELGDRYPAVRDEHAAILRRAISDGDGVEVSTEGDSFFAAFASPVAAVGPAVAAQRALAAHPWPPGTPVRVRMGLHTGEGVLGGDNYVGIDVNRAARVAGAAWGGQVIVSGATRGLVAGALPDGTALRDLGEHRLKDINLPLHLHDLVVAGLEADFPAPRTLDASPGNLPEQLTSFVGREDEIAEAVRLLGRARLLTLTGAGGTGKSRLALQVADRVRPEYRDGAFFVDLSAVADPALVPAAVARVLRVPEVPGRPLPDALADHLRDRRLLLVVDNFEQVAEAGPMVERLLAGAPGAAGAGHLPGAAVGPGRAGAAGAAAGPARPGPLPLPGRHPDQGPDPRADPAPAPAAPHPADRRDPDPPPGPPADPARRRRLEPRPAGPAGTAPVRPAGGVRRRLDAGVGRGGWRPGRARPRPPGRDHLAGRPVAGHQGRGRRRPAPLLDAGDDPRVRPGAADGHRRAGGGPAPPRRLVPRPGRGRRPPAHRDRPGRVAGPLRPGARQPPGRPGLGGRDRRDRPGAGGGGGPVAVLAAARAPVRGPAPPGGAAGPPLGAGEGPGPGQGPGRGRGDRLVAGGHRRRPGLLPGGPGHRAGARRAARHRRGPLQPGL